MQELNTVRSKTSSNLGVLSLWKKSIVSETLLPQKAAVKLLIP